jgi:hypothetical protein
MYKDLTEEGEQLRERRDIIRTVKVYRAPVAKLWVDEDAQRSMALMGDGTLLLWKSHNNSSIWHQMELQPCTIEIGDLK